MRAILNWTIGLIAAAGLTAGAVSMVASAMPASEASGSTATLQAQLDQLNRQKAALDAQGAAPSQPAPLTRAPESAGTTSTPTTAGRSAARSASPASVSDTTVPSTMPVTVPTTTPTTEPTTTPTTTPSWSGEHEGSGDQYEGGHDD